MPPRRSRPEPLASADRVVRCDKVYTVEEAAAAVGVPIHTVHRAIRAGELRYLALARRFRVTGQAIWEWLHSKERFHPSPTQKEEDDVDGICTGNSPSPG